MHVVGYNVSLGLLSLIFIVAVSIGMMLFLLVSGSAMSFFVYPTLLHMRMFYQRYSRTHSLISDQFQNISHCVANFVRLVQGC